MVKETDFGPAVEIVLKYANPGDLIEFESRGFHFIFPFRRTHWAVYVDDNDGKPRIVHYYYDSEDDNYKVDYALVSVIANGGKCRVYNKYDDRKDDPKSKGVVYDGETTVNRALECVEESKKCGRFKRFRNYNSEHFASWCRNGYEFSNLNAD